MGTRRMSQCLSIPGLEKHAKRTTTRIFQLFCFSRQSPKIVFEISPRQKSELRKISFFPKQGCFPPPNIKQISSYIPPNFMSKLVLRKTGSILLAEECCLLSLCPFVHVVLSGLIRPCGGNPLGSSNPALLTTVSIGVWVAAPIQFT